jgi:chromate transporter
VVIAIAAFVALAGFAVPFPLVIVVAALSGWWLGRRTPELSPVEAEENNPDGALIPAAKLHTITPSWRRNVALIGLGIPLWLLPVGFAMLLLGNESAIAQQGKFFAGTALVTFGGAYAVLAYVAQRAVEDYGWLSPGEMVRGLGLAETTPGPLIMVVQFVAFLGAFRAPGELNPWVAAVVGSLLTVWVTFVPCFLFIFVGAPYIEQLRANTGLASALRGVTAAVVGVIANLALYFAIHTLFTTSARFQTGPLNLELPEVGSFQPAVALLAAGAAYLFVSRRWSTLKVIGLCAAIGMVFL